jgi:hypothetical protein
MYELILNLLGKSIESPEYQDLLQSTGAPSSVYDVPISEADSLRMFEFYNFGFGLAYSLSSSCFRTIGCEYQIEAAALRPMLPFPDAGPVGIKPQDSKRTVQKKMAVLPRSSRKLKSYMRVTYQIAPHLVECTFNGKGSALKGFTVSLLEHMEQ